MSLCKPICPASELLNRVFSSLKTSFFLDFQVRDVLRRRRPTPKSEFLRWLVCGAAAGLAVDLSLYPLDTLKTRLQSEAGFRASGGFRNLYRGMSSVAIGSAPGAALFFTSYSSVKKLVGNESPLTNALGASIAETVACLVRVPTELIKQRAQANAGRTMTSIAVLIHKNDGFMGFYRGYVSTVAREIPFSLIEFPCGSTSR
ncbi:hypothetical protein L596_016930 [Steinernema carpocapsae]|uniref:Uncharacterized protein n=1 Tax=Steinernema carpocapsae TaxID=34508 RepID=A0A4V6A1M7_STECR|nr:hypothetical protein L596_016930 [Steinernema carpocapsae]